MSGEDKKREAPIHFELYRLLKNNINACNSPIFQYTNVEPERGVRNGAVDLVIDAKMENQIAPLLAIEVKKPTAQTHNYLLHIPESKEQVEGYAEGLQSKYFALTDGDTLRLFKLKSPLGGHQHIGDYRIQLTDKCIKHFLVELRELGEGKRKTLSLPNAPAFDLARFQQELTGLSNNLKNVFEQLGDEEGFKLKFKEHPRTRELELSFDSLKGVFSLAIEREKRELPKDTSYIYIQLSGLRKKLGAETLHRFLAKLSQFSCFKWVDPSKAERGDKSTWKNLKDIIPDEELRLGELKKQLEEWFQELSFQLKERFANK